jgi:membrane protease YdiL (CAAX protease family)
MAENKNNPGADTDLRPQTTGQRTRPGNFVFFGTLVESSLVLVAWILGWLTGLWTWADLAAGFQQFPSPVSLGVGVLATLPMLALLVLVLHASGRAFVRMRAFLEETLAPSIRDSSLVALLGLSLAAGLGEEWLFRGVLQAGLLQWGGGLPVPLAILIVGIIFGVCHWITPLYFLLATITGIYLGWLYWATGSLVAPVLAHALYDFIALVVIVRRQADPAVKQYPGGVEEAAGADAQPE